MGEWRVKEEERKGKEQKERDGKSREKKTEVYIRKELKKGRQEKKARR